MKKVLVISPYPEDEAIGCEGEIRQYLQLVYEEIIKTVPLGARNLS